jgi:hypothetical protein
MKARRDFKQADFILYNNWHLAAKSIWSRHLPLAESSHVTRAWIAESKSFIPYLHMYEINNGHTLSEKNYWNLVLPLAYEFHDPINKA